MKEAEMTAKGKITAARVRTNDRIIVKVSADSTVQPSATKTGEGVRVARVLNPPVFMTTWSNTFGRRATRVYEIITTEGIFRAAPVQTMWLAPEDAAGIKRAHAEALELDKIYEAYPVAEETPAEATPADEQAGDEFPARRFLARVRELMETTYTEKSRLVNHARAFDAAMAEDRAAADRENRRRWQEKVRDSAPVETVDPGEDRCESEGCDIREGDIECRRCGAEPVLDEEIDNSEDAFGDLEREEAEREELDSASNKSSIDKTALLSKRTDSLLDSGAVQPATGSAVVAVLERTWRAIREDHVDLPEIVIVTGSGWIGSPRWGHFRPTGWTGKGEFVEEANVHQPIRLGEMFIAGETLARGANHTLETMLHEAAHVLARVREVTDTSRQGRWHNAKFRQLAEEVGLKYVGDKGHPQYGFSEMLLTSETLVRYAQLLVELDAAIHLVIDLPGFVATGGGGSGGEMIHGGGRRPRGEGAQHSGSLKATCECDDEPKIIRLSRKVLSMGVVRCDDCRSLFARPAD